MASDKEYLAYICDQLSDLPGITYRAMMGEYVLYYQGRILGGIYDNRLLVKPVPAARKRMPAAPLELPYAGGGEMLLVEEVDDRAFLADLVCAMYEELPPPKKPKLSARGTDPAEVFPAFVPDPREGKPRVRVGNCAKPKKTIGKVR